MKIICTEKEKASLINSIAKSIYTCPFLECGIHTIEEFRMCDNCFKCIENTIEWELIK